MKAICSHVSGRIIAVLGFGDGTASALGHSICRRIEVELWHGPGPSGDVLLPSIAVAVVNIRKVLCRSGRHGPGIQPPKFIVSEIHALVEDGIAFLSSTAS